MTVIPIVIGALGTALKDLIRELVELEIGERIRTDPNCSIVEIDQNTEKSPRALRRLAVTQTTVRVSVNSGEKNSLEVE